MTNKTKASLVIVGLLALLVVVWLFVRPQNHPASAPTTHPASHAATTGATKATTRATHEQSIDPVSQLPWIDPAELPKEGRDTLALIDKGGPFPYPNNDGVVFSNAEGHLPKQKSGYYHEYTVPTPGASTRGARRIITGSGGEYYYTDDHYASFSRIRR